jgi:hypothetical protein
MYEQNSGGGGEGGHFEKPDIETYIHRIGELPVYFRDQYT